MERGEAMQVVEDSTKTPADSEERRREKWQKTNGQTVSITTLVLFLIFSLSSLSLSLSSLSLFSISFLSLSLLSLSLSRLTRLERFHCANTALHPETKKRQAMRTQPHACEHTHIFSLSFHLSLSLIYSTTLRYSLSFSLSRIRLVGGVVEEGI